MPNALVDVIGARTSASFGSITTNQLIPLLLLKRPDSTRKEASSNEIEQAGRNDEENLQFGAGTAPKCVSENSDS